MRVFPIDVGVPAGDQLFLDVRAINGQFRDGAAIAISGDAADANGATDDKGSEVIACSLSWDGISPFAPQFRGVDTGEPDLFAGGGGAGIAS